MPTAGACLRLVQLCLLNLLPVTHSDQHVVHAQLEETIQVTGVPTAILGDHGGDLHAGVKRFCEAHPTTRNSNDTTHMAANLLKARLEKNEHWKSLGLLLGQTKFQMQQTGPSGASVLAEQCLLHESRFALRLGHSDPASGESTD